jgi:hypothetical protein
MNRKDSVVKIDFELSKKIDNFIKKNKFYYASKKQVVNLAIIEFLKSHSLGKLDKRGKKG